MRQAQSDGDVVVGNIWILHALGDCLDLPSGPHATRTRGLSASLLFLASALLATLASLGVGVAPGAVGCTHLGVAENGGESDPRRSKPSPHVAFAGRVRWQSFAYDWMGNSIRSDDDDRGFYDRSLGVITNGTPSQGPYQLKSASSEPPIQSAAAGGPRRGTLEAAYDDAGNMVSLNLRRRGPCLPAGAKGIESTKGRGRARRSPSAKGSTKRPPSEEDKAGRGRHESSSGLVSPPGVPLTPAILLKTETGAQGPG